MSHRDEQIPPAEACGFLHYHCIEIQFPLHQELLFFGCSTFAEILHHPLKELDSITTLLCQLVLKETKN